MADMIEKALHYAETGQKMAGSGAHPTEVYEAIDRLRANPKYFLDWWSSTTEFRRAKLMRSNNIPVSGTMDDKIIRVNIAGKDGD